MPHDDALISQRWFILSHAALTMMSAGGLYLFSAYSAQLADSMNYSNVELGVIGTANNLGTWFGVTGGLFCAHYGLQKTAVAASALSCGGMICLALASLSIMPRSYLFASISTFAFSQGQGWAYLAAMKATLHNFNTVDRGSVVGCLVCFFALSSGFWATTYKAVFVHMNLALFFLCLGLGCGAMQLYTGLRTSSFTVGFEAPLVGWEQRHISYMMYYAMAMSLYILMVSLVGHSLSAAVYLMVWSVLLASVVALPFLPRIFHFLLPLATNASADNIDEAVPSQGASASTPVSPAAGELQALDHDPAAEGDETHELTLADLGTSPLFWLLMASVAFGLSFPITLINNCSTLVISLRPSSSSSGVVSVLVAFFAVFNCWGRMLTGYASSRFFLSRPRWQWFLAALLAQLSANFLLLIGWSWSVLYVAVPLAGLGIGGIFAVAPVATSDIFSAKYFPMAWGALTIAPCISTELISGLLAGSVADAASESSGTVIEGRKYCLGDGCYYPTFLVTFAVELLAIGCAVGLLWKLQRKQTNI